MCSLAFSSVFGVRRTGTPVYSLVLSVGSTAPAATDNRHEHSRLCVRHYTWRRLPHLNQFTASCGRDLCITGFSLNFGLYGSASQPPCTWGGKSQSALLCSCKPFVIPSVMEIQDMCLADVMLCMSDALTSRFKSNDSTPITNRTGIGVIYGL